jgi:hypothetical protein
MMVIQHEDDRKECIQELMLLRPGEVQPWPDDRVRVVVISGLYADTLTKGPR